MIGINNNAILFDEHPDEGMMHFTMDHYGNHRYH